MSGGRADTVETIAAWAVALATGRDRAHCCCHGRTCRSCPRPRSTPSARVPTCWPSRARSGSRRRQGGHHRTARGAAGAAAQQLLRGARHPTCGVSMPSTTCSIARAWPTRPSAAPGCRASRSGRGHRRLVEIQLCRWWHRHVWRKRAGRRLVQALQPHRTECRRHGAHGVGALTHIFHPAATNRTRSRTSPVAAAEFHSPSQSRSHCTDHQVGINGFGPHRAHGVSRRGTRTLPATSSRGHSTTCSNRTTWRTCCSTTPCTAASRGRSRSNGTRCRPRQAASGHRSEGSGGTEVGQVGADVVVEATGLFLTKTPARSTSPLAQEVIFSAAEKGRHADVRLRCQRQELRRPGDHLTRRARPTAWPGAKV